MRRGLTHTPPTSILRAALLVACVGLALGDVARVGAQQPTTTPAATSPHLDSLRRAWRVPPPPVQLITTAAFLGAPGSSLGNPSATGTGTGDYFVGAGFQGRTRYTHDADGGFGFGFGLGDPEQGVGLETVVTSFSSVRHPPFSIGGISAKLHRRFDNNQVLVAAGYENLASWGALSDGGRSIYAEVGRIFLLRESAESPFSILSASVGLGDGRFRSEQDVKDKRETIGVFGGLGLRITPQVALSSEWTGQNLNAGFMLTPLPGRGIVATVGLADLTHHSGDGARFIMSLGFGLSTRQDRRILSEEDRNAIFKQP
jgi:hypothetical protein